MLLILYVVAEGVLRREITWGDLITIGIASLVLILPLMPLLWRLRWRVIVTKPNVTFGQGAGYCTDQQCIEIPKPNEVYSRGKVLVIEEPCEKGILIRLDVVRLPDGTQARCSIHFVKRRLLRRTVVADEAEISAVTAVGHRAVPGYWWVQGDQRPIEGGLSSITIQRSDLIESPRV